ncbi:hypothetical protein G8C92_27705 [Paenibacillus donghaensis]|uniref:hypothetical protein n=1 Tax=Paenibacillus donghaensis TaxID=414771 RepID=UPI0018846022|nr:hypothetical protein [Paenibacillus donghaensis]MBE9917791.1 hypothetical protein [Paenibacillus donghaensis]
MKRIMLLALGLTLLITVTACGDDNNSAKAVTGTSPIEVKANNQDIHTVMISKTVEKPDYGNMDSFQSILKNNAADLPYVKLGEKIQVKFHDQTNEPDSYELIDYVLTEEGKMKYAGAELIRPEMEFDKGTASFILKENMLAYASSDSKDYEPGAVLRGFRLLCKWNNDTQEVTFVIRTDAISKDGQTK